MKINHCKIPNYIGDIEKVDSTYNTSNNIDKTVLESDEEFELRIKQIPPIEVGLAFLDFSHKNLSNENLLFSFSLKQSLPIVLE
ncbi:hypothetical protein [Neobacillus niacini]|uniref:hypothetical protein n=1 Tax=Neobacillus niacini TaxID=86668 RepID=UPI0021CB7CA1|nr:hypothetical protein [Neobacillus niacini]MCM3767245.1 hypothetical protein [Neobacillus niacini]